MVIVVPMVIVVAIVSVVAVVIVVAMVTVAAHFQKLAPKICSMFYEFWQ